MGIEQPVLLYQAAPRIYPRRAKGRYANLRLAAMLALLGIYYAMPWLSLGGQPLVWLDLPHRQFHIFGLLLAPQDLIFLSGLLAIAALTLFFFTTVAGRLWCGYACPQTVWTEAFLWIEHFIEGDRHARQKLDQAPWGGRKILRKGAKHAAWLLFGLLTGLTFVAYFVPARELFPAALSLELAGWPLFWSLFYGFATWGNAGFMREQVCKYMCPYARFQSAMFDRDTLIIAYDSKRGEPRKTLAKKMGQPAADCTDCSLCVQVCPVGIDIRKGLQYECIACAACIDACDSVMDSVGRPRGLVHYTSSNHEAGGRLRLLRPRVIGYGLIWLLLCAGFASALWLRNPLAFDVIRDRHSLYRELPDGSIENLYVIKLENKDRMAHAVQLSAALSDGQVLYLQPAQLQLQSGEKKSLTVSVRLQPRPAGTALAATSAVVFTAAAADDSGLKRTHTAAFLSGESR